MLLLFCTGSYVSLDKIPLMSPAKIFADMKERRSRAEQREAAAAAVSSCTRGLFQRGECVTTSRQSGTRFCRTAEQESLVLLPQVDPLGAQMHRSAPPRRTLS